MSLLAAATSPLHPDIQAVLPVTGSVNPGGLGWADSYSVGDRCYCAFSTFDHGIGDFIVKTPLGWRTVHDVCTLILGPGPGLVEGETPLYNDVQCGNGPPNDAGDEHVCPGRTDVGPPGCGMIGPRWNFDGVASEAAEPTNNNDSSIAPTQSPTVVALPIHPDVREVLPVAGGVNPGGLGWADSYSVGDKCFCAFSTFDHGIGDYLVETPLGWRTVRDVCTLILGPGPGLVVGETPLYNDVQCGNGPPNDAGDEHICPGRTDIGPSGCGMIGPRWKFNVTSSKSEVLSDNPSAAPTHHATKLPSDNPSVAPAHYASEHPSDNPSAAPVHYASKHPSDNPLAAPAQYASKHPSDDPSAAPSSNPPIMSSPTLKPTTASPDLFPTALPSRLNLESFSSPSNSGRRNGLIGLKRSLVLSCGIFLTYFFRAA